MATRSTRSIVAQGAAPCQPAPNRRTSAGITTKKKRSSGALVHHRNGLSLGSPRTAAGRVSGAREVSGAARGEAQRCNAISKVLIANRGEIAVRVIRACKELGLKTVAVYSVADENSLHVQLADEAVCIGPAPSQESYLNVPNILAAAIGHGADAIHPGYGFLSENASFVSMCRDHGLKFIGPDPESITLMGDKSTARDTMKNAGVPTVPGSDGLIETGRKTPLSPPQHTPPRAHKHSSPPPCADVSHARALNPLSVRRVDEEAIKCAEEIGFPLMIKATAGGGGRGMRLATNMDEFLPLMKQAQGEAKAAFGNGAVYIERYVQVRPRLTKGPGLRTPVLTPSLLVSVHVLCTHRTRVTSSFRFCATSTATASTWGRGTARSRGGTRSVWRRPQAPC